MCIFFSLLKSFSGNVRILSLLCVVAEPSRKCRGSSKATFNFVREVTRMSRVATPNVGKKYW